MIVKCLHCGKEFNARPDKIKKGEGIFCSKFCWNEHKKTFRIKKVCRQCGKEFIVRPCFEKMSFCSKKCADINRVGKYTGKNSPTWTGGEITKECIVCKKEFKIERYRNDVAKFCSHKCIGDWNSVNKIREKHPNWKGGSLHKTLIRTSNKYKSWRLEIFKRDNFTCQKCGDSNGGNLHAHHKKRFSVILSDIKQKFPLLFAPDIANNYPEMWDISNGVTLCESCHEKEHRSIK